MIRAFTAFVSVCGVAFGQAPAFEVASVKAVKVIEGQDGHVTLSPGRFYARNATLKRLIHEAWQLPYSQITGGPAWLNSDEFDVDARSEGPAAPEQLRMMLRALLTERFALGVRAETKESRVYLLLPAKDGPHLRTKSGDSGPGTMAFHGDLFAFADYLAVQLTIPLIDDPTRPSHATGSPVPVLNQTGISGTYDLRFEMKPEAGGDTFTLWERVLRDQLGLRLQSSKAPVEVLVIEHTDRIPAAN